MGNLDSGFLLPYAWLPLFDQLKTADEKWETLCALIERQRYNKEFPAFDEHSLQFSICSACEPTITARINGQRGGQGNTMKRNEKTLSSALDKGASEANKSKSKNKKEIEYIVSYLNKRTGKQYRAGTRATERLINARLRDGFTVEDFCRVIDIKCAEWMNDAGMSKYLRPETLFGSKFDTYLNQSIGTGYLFGEGDNDILPY